MVPNELSDSTTIIQGNIRGLWSYDKTKILSIERFAELYNSIVIALSETHLFSEIEDSEVAIKGWSLFRADRSVRKCGGTIIYVRDGIPVTEESNFSNCFCEIMAVYLPSKNTAIVSLYRPPGSPTEKFLEALGFLDSWMERIQDKYVAPNFYITGDFNLNFLEDWSDDLLQGFRDTIVRREGEVISEDKFQAQNLLNMCDKWNLSQSVRVPTREDNILDLILVNSPELIKDIETVVNSKLSDHNLIIAGVNMSDEKAENAAKKNFCDTEIPQHNLEDASEEDWQDALDWLMNQDLDNLNESELVNTINKLVMNNFPIRNKSKVTKEGNNFRSNNKIPREVRTLFRKKRKISKILSNVKTKDRCVKALNDLRTVEEKIKASDFKRKISKEKEAIQRMKENPKYFFTYTKNLRKTSGLVGPLTDSDNKIIDEPVAETLQRQYSSVWSIPSKDHTVEDPNLFFKTSVSEEPEEILFKVRFTKEKVMKAIENLNKEAAAGPDGVSNLLLYKLRSGISGPLAKIFQDSMDRGKYLWKKQFVIPVLKSGKSKNKAESFRPVSLTSQIGKLMKRIVMDRC